MLNKSDRIFLLGGHFTPALAVIEELQERGFFDLHWIGTKYSQTNDRHLSAEYQVIKQKNITFHSFRAGKLWRKWTLRTLLKAIFNLILIPAGFAHALLLVLRLRPKIIISFGGYLALPVVIMGRLAGVRVVTHEQTLSPGLANRIIAVFANKILISWTQTAKFFPKNKTIYTGNPIRKEVLRSATNVYNFDSDLPVIYVTGGNQGANTINKRLIKILHLLLKKASVIHQTGSSSLTSDFNQALALKQSLPDELKSRYLVKEHIFGDEIGEVFAKSDLIVSRSGANTITEILALGKLSILIPLPWSSGNEQYRNAEFVATTGFARILKQYDAMPPQELLTAIESGIAQLKLNQAFNGESMEEAAEEARKLVNLKAQIEIVDIIERQFA